MDGLDGQGLYMFIISVEIQSLNFPFDEFHSLADVSGLLVRACVVVVATVQKVSEWDTLWLTSLC